MKIVFLRCLCMYACALYAYIHALLKQELAKL